MDENVERNTVQETVRSTYGAEADAAKESHTNRAVSRRLLRDASSW